MYDAEAKKVSLRSVWQKTGIRRRVVGHSGLVRGLSYVDEEAMLHNVEDAEAEKCANCNREASAECSLCRRTPYCSTYCQKKDWASHQIECLRSVPTIHADQHQSIMLIVESQQ
ncbi:hypothetical protein MSG28_001252 [Choristoneura fumiferana]|uniref:Uncharacterized protein n=1 Tax=Choristoneura fumiferana TaxID=7141 RepID=A0ACC0K4F0_CHOFU|nr:hypothetical protein MSG28_001252 [Choristoneura fumiferana]